MASDDILEAVVFQEAPRDVGPELAAHPSLAGRPPVHGLGVGPQQLAHDPLLGRLLVPLGGLDVRQGDVVLAEQTSVHHQDLRVLDLVIL